MPPWELLKQNRLWYWMALSAEGAETNARIEAAERQQRRAQ